MKKSGKRISQERKTGSAEVPERTDRSEKTAEPSSTPLPISPPIVGIGASAGGLEAFTQLLRALPTDTGMAFVLVQHLEPKHESVLTTLLARATKMPVREVREGMGVEPNHVYVIPANADLSLLDGLLHIVGRKAAPGHHLPIDHFLHSLAETRGPRAIGVILSGTASDGTAGIRAIKEAGGITFAQDSASARFDGMPRSAVASGCVDFVLPPERIAKELARIARHPSVGLLPVDANPPLPALEEEWADLYRILRAATGVDFRLYKKATIKRRLARRMAHAKAESLRAYLKILARDRAELNALFNELLILVTKFFRDSEVFLNLQKAIFPRIVKHKAPGEPVRIWVAGCSTGEEAYSIAISLIECFGHKAPITPIQIFATDVNEDAIEKARAGIYTAEQVKGVSKERLRRFFTRVDDHYQVIQNLREMCVFARHDLTSDPPFSKLDLVSCRNVLIYFESELQRRVLAAFHYGLKDDGILLLGKSETLSAYPELFIFADHKHKFFRKNVAAHAPFAMAELAYAHSAPSKPLREAPAAASLEKEIDQIVWERYEHAGVVVDGDLQILHFRGDTSPYLRLAPGKASFQLMRILREEIVLEVRTALQKVQRTGRAVRREGIAVRHNRRVSDVNIEVRPLPAHSGHEICFLILFEMAPAVAVRAKPAAGRKNTKAGSRELPRLRNELARTREHVRVIIRDQESTNEELKTANEEALSSMEELQSTNEELETAKEELQSSNEELITLNEQLQNRNTELAGRSDQLNNVLTASDIPILVLDGDLRIRLFTPPAEKVMGLLPGDVGRPIGKLRLGVHVPDLEELISTVIQKGTDARREVQTDNGRWHLLNIRPFWTSARNIEGALLALIDIEDLKRNQVALKVAGQRAQESEATIQALMQSATQAVLSCDQDGRIIMANPAAEKMFGYVRDDLVGRSLESLMPARFRERHVLHRSDWSANLRNRPMDTGLELEALRKDGSEFPIDVSLSYIETPSGVMSVAFIADITERKQLAQTLSEYKDQLQKLTGALLFAQESGNREVARELHDVFSQELAAAGMEISSLKQKLKARGEIAQRLSNLGAKIARLSEDIHRKSRELHPAVLEELGLEPALRQECETFQQSSGIPTGFTSANLLAKIPQDVALCLYRVTQECFRNIRKHAPESSAVRMSLGGGPDGITVCIEDNGNGFELDAALRKGGLGLISMEERVRLVNGKLTIRSQPGKGTTVTAFVPLEKKPA